MASLQICSIIKDEEFYLREWLAYHFLAGVSGFVIYDHSSADGSADLLRDLGKRYPIQLIDWDYTGEGNPQTAAYQHGVALLRGHCDFVGFLDADEFLVPSSGQPLGQVLDDFDESVGAIAVNQRLFGSSGHLVRRSELVTSRFTHRAAAGNDEGFWFKTVARPECIETCDSAHSVVLSRGRYVYSDGSELQRSTTHPGRADQSVDGVLHVNHYMLKSLEEFWTKQERGAISEKVNWPHIRYSTEFFSSRDACCNDVVDEELWRLGDSIMSMMNHMEG